MSTPNATTGEPNATARDPRDRAAPTTTMTAAPGAVVIGDPAALGLAGFGLTTFMLSVVNGHVLNAGVEPAVFGMALMTGGLAQLLAGMWEFRNGNTFGATAFTAFGAFWLSFWALIQFYASTIPPAQAGHAVGLFLFTWFIFTAYMFIPSFGVSRVVNVVFGLLTLTFLFLAIGNYGDHTTWTKIGGWLGILTAIAALYGSCAVVTNATFGRAVLPVGAVGRAPLD